MKEKHIFEKIVEVPAEALDGAVQEAEKLGSHFFSKRPLRKAKKFWHMLGPGLTTGAADDDPSGIATYSQTGAKYGFGLLWLALFTFPLMTLVQEMCARIGMVTGKGLAANIREHYSRPILLSCTVLLFAANVFNLGADLGAMAQAIQLIVPQAGFILLLVFITVLSLSLQIFTTYERYAHYLKYLALILLLYVFATLSIQGLDWRHILTSAVVPHITWGKEQLLLICAILGTTISPYLFFWQTSQEVEERILHKEEHLPTNVGKKEIKQMRIDTVSGMFLSNLIMFFIITACGATLFASHTTIVTAADAASALRPIAGNAAYVLFALGIIGTGFLAVPVLAGSAAYAMAESFHWKFGLYRKLKDAHAFYGIIIIAMGVGLLLNFVGIDPIRALIYSAVANGIVAPIVLVFIVHLSSDKSLMGRYANSKFVSWLGWIIVGLMTVVALSAVAAIWF
jgi:NRAMP (natural resistance-associated macrophage protein)-like metal ion transporter